MNDRFKFRFWDKDRKIMIDENSDIEYIANIYGRGEWWGCIEAKMPKILGCFDTEYFAIMQCTGLKDKNGKLIFEGDIIKTERHNLCDDNEKFEILYSDTFCQLLAKSLKSGHYLDLIDAYNAEIIGNIYENEDLIDERN